MYYNKKYQDFIDDNFFVIDSHNCKNIESKLYGFVIQENNIIALKKNYNKHIEKKENGVYVNIIREDEKIIIEQDFAGGYGLFLYNTDNYFALSNSFFYLVLYLKEHNILSLSLDTAYLNYFMTQSLTSLSIERTLVKEIKQLDKDIKIVIDTSNNTINYIRDILPKNIYDIDSPECFEILDKWFSKYCSLIQSLYTNNYNLSTDLSGGKDSRLVLTLFYHLNLLQKIQINSSTASTTRAKEDYNIASQIAAQYNFQLNSNQTQIPNIKIALELNLLLLLFSKLGIHKELRTTAHYCIKPVFLFNGSSGETLRSTWKSSEEEFLKKYIYDSEQATGISNQFQIEFIKESFSYIQQIFNKSTGIELYDYARTKMHVGKGTMNNILSNCYTISPLHDPMLRLININNNNYDELLLLSIIYQRYMPGVIDIPFDKGQIKDSVKKQADEIQNKYPKHIEIHDNFTLDLDERVIPEPENEHSPLIPQDLLSAFFRTKEVRNFASFVLNDKIYYYCKNLAKNKQLHQSDANAKTLASLCIFYKVILSNNFNIYSYITNHKENSPSKKLALTTLKFLTYQILTRLFSQPCLKSIIGPSLLNKLKNKQEKYYDKLLPLLDNLSFKC